ncbi:site-2 protease family protein [Botrimarina mediterranea]|uniref:Peptidase family M50 n=1 Tax=Botrimarina mediterranea TaxID=2528022 RepID=A0A518KB79_9BACT|nr:site-2 protease family protein [Botrimarina mediterranea]QDV75054.1 Peptidase family M50 [Botrimarina mediterranea]
MLFTSAAPGPYDVRFSLLGVPVRIAPVFWIVALFLGGGRPPEFAIVWVVAVVVSILVHELGHAVLQRAFGGQPEIVLYAFGGYASAYGVRESWWRNILIALAGPFAGFFLAALVWGYVELAGEPEARLARVFVGDMLFINIVWGVLNLFPIWPLDGGRVAREVLTLLMKPSTGIVVSLAISAVVAAGLALWCWVETQSIWNTALFGLLAYQSYETMQQYRASRGGW